MIIYENILREFQKQKVKYVLVGGIAVNLLGSLRSTSDLDILVEMSNENLSKVVMILKKNGFHVKQPVDPMGIVDKNTREDWIKNKDMKAFNFYKGNALDTLKEVDIVICSPVSYKRAQKTAVRIKVSNITLPVISIDNLVKMKKKSGRTVDKFDVTELKKIKRLKKKK